jgi:glycosyltransferase involved in cell wall biosynthesis
MSPLEGKRVAMVVFSYYPNDPRPRRAAEALVGEGMTVDLVCLTESAADARREHVRGVDVLRVPLKRRRGGMVAYVLQYATFLLSAAAIVAVRSLGRRYDLVYVHNMPDVLVLTGLLPKLFGAKLVLDLHDPMPELMMTIFGLREDTLPVRLLKRLERWSIGVSDRALTVNLACKRLFASRSCAPDKLEVVMNSPDERIFGFRTAPAPESSRRPFVLMYHGSLVERNGLDVAVEALARVRARVPDVELRVYGPATPFLERVMTTVRARGLDGAVQYLGPRRIEDIAVAIDDCDLGVIPNQRNTFTELNTPTRIFEYLARGKPVVAPRAAGIQDYFDEGSLVLFELGDAEDLARKIEHVLAHPGEASEIARRGQGVYRAHAWPAERAVLVGVATDLLRGAA